MCAKVDSRMGLLNLSQPSTVEKAGIELQQLEVENLFNILIELPSYSGIPKDVNRGSQKAKPLELIELNKLNRKKRKRVKGKENVVPEHSGNLNPVQNSLVRRGSGSCLIKMMSCVVLL